MIRFLFKQPQPKRFSFKPRFYNERKEQLQARVDAIRREQELGDETSNPEALRSRIHSAWRDQDRKDTLVKSNRNVIIVAVVLSLIAYLVLTY